MFYQKFISVIFLLFVCSFFHSKLKAQESAFPEFKYLGKVHGGNFIYDDVYDLTYNPSNHSVAFKNGELFGFMVISLDSLKIIFDNRKLKKNRFSIKSDQSINVPYNLSANSRGNFVFYDFSSNKRLRFVGKGNQFNNAFIKEIRLCYDISRIFSNSLIIL